MSYEYLAENAIPVKLAREVDRVEERIVPLSPKDEERARRFHRESIVIDFHIHLTILPENIQDLELLARSGRPATGYEGVRKSGMTACFSNARTTLGDGCTERTDAGLSSLGFKVIERMNRLGMLIDLSHSSDLASKETIDASKAPCCFTHTFARSIFDNPRGKTDELLKLVAQRGGVIGIAAVPNLISNKPVQTIFDVLDHVDYIVKLVGIDHVAIGTDCMFGDHVALHKNMHKVMDMSKALNEFPGAYIDYMENPGQWPNFTRALVARGYSDGDIKKILGENVLRILKQTIG